MRMRKSKNIFITKLLVLLMLISLLPFSALAAGGEDFQPEPMAVDYEAEIDRVINNLTNYYKDNFQNLKDDWLVLDFVLAGKIDQLFASERGKHFYVKEAIARIDPNTTTDYQRVALALSALKIDVSKLVQYGDFYDGNGNLITNLLAEMAKPENNMVINSAIFGIQAYDAGGYDDIAGDWSRENLINYIIDNQFEDGGWGFSPLWGSEPDTTGMAITALAAYAEDASVQASIDRGLAYLMDIQSDAGGFPSFGSDNTDSLAEIIIALISLGIDPLTDERFIKIDPESGQEYNPLGALLTFEGESGLFYYNEGWQDDNSMSTEKAFKALIAYQVFLDNLDNNQDKTYIYRFGPADSTPDQQWEYEARADEIYVKKLPSKIIYKLSEPADYSGLVVNAVYEKREYSLDLSELNFSGFDTSTSGAKTINVGYLDRTTDFEIQVKADEDSGGGVIVPRERASVSVSYPGKNRTLYSKTSLEIDADETAISMLAKTGLDYETVGSSADSRYVKRIGDLSEFDYGPGSGWMFKVNGDFPNRAASSYPIREGDYIEWVYTDNLGQDVGDSWTGPSQPKPETKEPETEIAVKATVEDEKAKISLSAKDLQDSIKAAKEAGDKLVIDLQVEAETKLSQISLSKEAVSEISKDENLELTLKTPQGSIDIRQAALASIAKQAVANGLSFVIERPEASDLREEVQDFAQGQLFDISIISGDDKISYFDGQTLTISLPYKTEKQNESNDQVDLENSQAEEIKVWYLDELGNLEEVESSYDPETGLVTFVTDHLSYYLIGTEADLARILEEKIPAEPSEPEKIKIDYMDVGPQDWFYHAVNYVVGQELFLGISEDSFGPNLVMTRAMLVTVLHRLDGLDAGLVESLENYQAVDFIDVDVSSWYGQPVAWAQALGLVNGYGDGFFGSHDPVSREQIAVILHRYAGYKAKDVLVDSKMTELIKAYDDYEDISTWARESMAWANKEGLIKGRTASQLASQESASRAELATILERWLKEDSREEAEENTGEKDYPLGLDKVIQDTGDYLVRQLASPERGTVGGDWTVIGLARANYQLPANYLNSYYQAVARELEEKSGKLDERKYTEYSRLILALTAAGYNPENLAGYDLTLPLADFDQTIWQGLNGAIYALLALDSGNYDLAYNPEAKVQASRDLYIEEILTRQMTNGAFSLYAGADSQNPEEDADIDITAMAIQALAKYKDRPDVKASIQEALSYLSRVQNHDGGYSNREGENVETTAQVIVALTEMGLDLQDPNFVKGGRDLLDNLLDYYVDGEGFRHNLTSTNTDLMASEQAFYALVAADRFYKGQASLYRMSEG